jgi:hypothetical protein
MVTLIVACLAPHAVRSTALICNRLVLTKTLGGHLAAGRRVQHCVPFRRRHECRGVGQSRWPRSSGRPGGRQGPLLRTLRPACREGVDRAPVREVNPAPSQSAGKGNIGVDSSDVMWYHALTEVGDPQCPIPVIIASPHVRRGNVAPGVARVSSCPSIVPCFVVLCQVEGGDRTRSICARSCPLIH